MTDIRRGDGGSLFSHVGPGGEFRSFGGESMAKRERGTAGMRGNRRLRSNK